MEVSNHAHVCTIQGVTVIFLQFPLQTNSNHFCAIIILLLISLYHLPFESHGVAGDHIVWEVKNYNGSAFPIRLATDIIATIETTVPSLRFFLCSEDCDFILENAAKFGARKDQLAILRGNLLKVEPWRRFDWRKILTEDIKMEQSINEAAILHRVLRRHHTLVGQSILNNSANIQFADVVALVNRLEFSANNESQWERLEKIRAELSSDEFQSKLPENFLSLESDDMALENDMLISFEHYDENDYC